MSANRRKRHQRQDPPPPMRMTARDVQILEAVYHYRTLSQAQIRRFVFTGLSPTTAQRRLFLLYHNAYLERQFLPSIGGIVTSPMLYLLDRRGGEYLVQQAGYDEIRWKPSDNRVGYEYLEHLLAINTFRIEITLACQSAGLPLHPWLDDTTLKQDYDRVPLPGSTRPVAVIPDGYFAIQLNTGINHFFLELDRGTMDSGRFKRKVQAYQAYARLGLSKQRFGTANFRVLTVTQSQTRAANLKQATEAIGGGHHFWFGVLEHLTAATVLTRPVWQLASRVEPAMLIMK